MFVVSAKLSRVLPYLGLGALAVVAVVLLLSGKAPATVPVASEVAKTAIASESVSEREARVSFLRQCGWIVSGEQEQSEAVAIPAEFDAVYAAFNSIQLAQGYDLTPYAGKTVMSYTYPVQNYPGESDSVYAELLVRSGEVIGGTVYSSTDSNVRHGLFYERTNGQ